MLLRRVTEHVRSQNWTAVLIDFLIVVVGVFIGIQVANWNEVRQEQALERVLLERLQRDFQQLLELDSERYALTMSAPDKIGVLIGALRAGSEAPRDVVWPGIEQALVTYATTPPSPTYEELLATGRLSRLTSETLRQKLASFQRSRLSEDNVLAHLQNQGIGSPVYQHVTLDPRLADLRISGTYDWDHLSETLPYLQERFIYTQAMANWRRNSHDIARDILAHLEEELR